MHMAAIVRGGPLPVGSSWNLGAHFLDTTPKATQSYAQAFGRGCDDRCLQPVALLHSRRRVRQDINEATLPLRRPLH